MSFTTIAEVLDPAMARVLVAALRAHGFHPTEGSGEGLPGLPGVSGPRGFAVTVPDGEAGDAKVLAAALLAEMKRPTPEIS